MAESAIIYVLEKLTTIFLNNDLGLVRETGGGVQYLRRELEKMTAFLRSAYSLEESDEEIKVWVRHIREMAHDIEDLLDEFLILQAHDNDHAGEVNWLNVVYRKLSCCVRNWKARYRIASEIQAINVRLKDIGEARRALGQKIATYSEQSATGYIAWQDQRRDALLLDQTDLVGINKPKKDIVKMLFEGGSGRQVVVLTGMGGLGKTTLAKQVYDDDEVKKYFAVHAWITVSGSFRVEDLLREMVHQLFNVISRAVPNEVDKMSTDQLRTTINKLLQNTRYFIVLDDVWRINEWNAVKHAFPTNNCGSRVMVTTRNADLDFTSLRKSEGRTYKVEPLSDEQSWALFCRKTFHEDVCPDYLQKICNCVLTKCGGLPLAIVAVGGVLATKDKKNICQWEMVSRSLGAEIEDNNKLSFLKRVLSLSFNDLPYYLQSCFLYLSVFPEDHQIGRLILIRLWVAEGFVKFKEGKTLEEVAEDYFNELLRRSLIQVAMTTTDGRVKTCRVQDILREIIISKSREHNFAVIAKEHNATWPDKVRRLSINNKLENMHQGNRCFSQLRSLFLFGVADNQCLHKLFPEGFRFIKVLKMRGAALTQFPIVVTSLYLLRYLSLRDTKVKSVPRSIGKLQHLETLDLKHSYVTELPEEISKLRKLCHLLVYRYEIGSYTNSKYGFKAPARIGDLQSLKKLCLVEANQGPENILVEIGKLVQLRRLGITRMRKEDGEFLSSSIGGMLNLLTLSITSLNEDEEIDFQHLISPPPLLQRLYLTGRLERIPHWIRRLPSLVKIYLKWSRLLVDPLDSLQCLPNLVHLELLQVYEGEELCFTAGGFKNLKHLGINKFDKLKCIKFEVGTLPRIEKLSIHRCKSLMKVPFGVVNLVSLKVLEFFDMPSELTNSIRPDKDSEDYWIVKHIPEVWVG